METVCNPINECMKSNIYMQRRHGEKKPKEREKVNEYISIYQKMQTKGLRLIGATSVSYERIESSAHFSPVGYH